MSKERKLLREAFDALSTERKLRQGYTHSSGIRIVSTADDVLDKLSAALARTHQSEQAAQPEQAAKASLREAAQNALVTLDGIANANPRDKADFETPAEWIAWAKSRARWAADALRAPVSQEIYAERILRQMLAMPEEEPGPAQQAHWYSVTKDGRATLCIDQADAIETSRQSDLAYPRFAPHVATRLVAIDSARGASTTPTQ